MAGWSGRIRGLRAALGATLALAAAAWAFDGGVPRYKRIDETVLGDHVQVPGVAGQRIRVYVLKLFCQGNNTLFLKDSTPTTLDGPIDFNGTATTLLPSLDPLPHYITEPGTSLILTTSSNGDCNGFLWYTQGP